jgi:hypothetical protein
MLFNNKMGQRSLEQVQFPAHTSTTTTNYIETVQMNRASLLLRPPEGERIRVTTARRKKTTE